MAVPIGLTVSGLQPILLIGGCLAQPRKFGREFIEFLTQLFRTMNSNPAVWQAMLRGDIEVPVVGMHGESFVTMEAVAIGLGVGQIGLKLTIYENDFRCAEPVDFGRVCVPGRKLAALARAYV
jgi:hypothetical protein